MERFYNHLSSSLHGTRFTFLHALDQEGLQKRWALHMIRRLYHWWVGQPIQETERERMLWLQQSRHKSTERFDKLVFSILHTFKLWQKRSS